MNEALRAALARELSTFQVLLTEAEGCASCIGSCTSLTLPHPIAGAPIPAPIFINVAKAIKTQNQILNRLTKVLEAVLRD